MASLAQRFHFGSKGTNTVNVKMQYRITLQLGDVDLLFQNAPGTPAGRKERLQVIGLLPHPLGHANADACFQYVWANFAKAALAPNPAVPLADGAADTALKTAIEDYLVDGGQLPTKGQFARIRVPGDFHVLHRDFDERYFSEPQFTLGRGTPFANEERFYQANPALGKIPLVALVEKKKASEPNTAWRPAANEWVHFQLRKPDKLPAYQAPGAVVKNVAGAKTWISGVTGAPLRSTTGVQLKNVRKTKHGKPGPAGYLERHAYSRNDPNFPKPKKADPQARNAWFDMGGKRAMAAAGNVIDTADRNGVTQPNVFDAGAVGQFYLTYNQIFDVHSTNKKNNPDAVYAMTDANGEAGVIFAPSRVGGDRYKLRAYVGTKKRKAKFVTGTMVRWRTVRLSRNITVNPPAQATGLDNKIQQQFNAHHAACGHSAASGGRFCGRCMLREGDVPVINFGTYMTKELSKAYCELLVDRNADVPAHTAITATKLQAAIDELATDMENGKQLSGVMMYTQSIGRTDGATATFTATLPFGSSILPKNVKVIVADRVVAIDDGNGNFVGSGANMDVIHRAGVKVNGTVNYGTGQLTLTLSVPPPPNKDVKVRYTLTAAIDWRNLVYHSSQSPFLLNLRSVQDYNTRINRNDFPPITTEDTLVNQAMTPAAFRNKFTANLPPGISDVTVKVNGNAPADGTMLVRANELTGLVEAFPLAEKTEHFAYSAAANGASIDCTLQSAAQAIGMALFRVKLKMTDNTEQELGFQRNFDGQFMVTCTDALARGVQVAYGAAARRVRITFLNPVANLARITILYPAARALPVSENLTVDAKVARIYDNTHPAPTNQKPPRPPQEMLNQVARIISWYLMVKLIRAVEDNKGYMPGIMLLRSPLRDTWSAVWDSKGFHEGKGLCNGFFLFFGNKWRSGGYDAAFEVGDGSTSEPHRFEPLVLHEMSHCLYLNHFPSGGNISGARPDQHDAFDACIMGYGDHNNDLCGQCTATYMGLNSREPRMKTWKGPEMMGPSLWTSTNDEAQDPAKYKLRHVEPPEIATPELYRSSDDVFEMLLNCPVGDSVYRQAMRSMGWNFVGGAMAPPLGSEGLIAMKLDAKGGRGSCDPLPGDVGFTCVDRIALNPGDIPHPEATVAQTALLQTVQTLEGNDIAVQILIMELSNLLHRFDFFDLDTRAYRGKVGMQEYVKETERIEYNGGVTNVIQAYNSCHAMWNARLCTKQEASHCTGFDDYFDNVLVTEHKDKYFGAWHTGMMRPFYIRKLPNLANFSYQRLDALMTTIKEKFGYDSYGKKRNYDLYEDDDAVWTLLQHMYTVDPNWDADSTNKILDWALGVLGAQRPTNTPMQKVQAVIGAPTPP